ncbi:MAG: phosphate--acyl-ACP acyltransferase [Anaerolineae bacterium]|nr:hypothetical protein [Thermoflexus sp.]MDW8064717.1 phosphate--acyl-ACP acyltransferase [Anaerolineae bacterium]
MSVRVVLDAIGRDHAPGIPVEGAVWALHEIPELDLILVGQGGTDPHQTGPPFHARPFAFYRRCPQVVEMHEHIITVKTKRDSSTAVGMRMVRSREAEAFVSMGNTGAVMTAALFHLSYIPWIAHTALATVYPTAQRPCLLLDIGANTDPKPLHLLQFAMMGVAYAERILGRPNPRVGLLLNGEEPSKGSLLVQEAHRPLQESGLNFIENVEARDPSRGLAEVVVTDGFTGNVVIKHLEGTVSFLARFLMGQRTDGKLDRLRLALALPGLLLAAPGLLFLIHSLRRIFQHLDCREYGGAPLLG